MSRPPESLVERGLEKKPATKAGAAEAVRKGALAQGVNVSTLLGSWFPLLSCISGF